MCLSDKMTPIYILRLSKVWSMLHHGSVWLVHKKMLLNTFMYFFGIFLLFFITKFVFLSFSFLFLIKYQISAIRNVNWWFPTVSGTVCKAGGSDAQILQAVIPSRLYNRTSTCQGHATCGIQQRRVVSLSFFC